MSALNNVNLVGRTTKKVDVKYSKGDQPLAIARFNLAVPRPYKKDSEQETDFIGCVAFGKTAEFLGKYGEQGVKFVVRGRIQTGRYTNKDGQTVYTTEVVCEEVEFAESKSSSAGQSGKSGSTGLSSSSKASSDGFMDVPEIGDDDLPFN